MATTRPTTTTAPILTPPVIAALGGQPATFRRVDLPLGLSAPANLVSASSAGVVAIGWRAVGAAGQSASAAFSIDGQQWRTVNTPWSDGPTENGLPRSFGAPRALAYGDGTFLSVGERVDLAADFEQTSNAIAARSRDGTNWETIDLQPSLGSLHPTLLVRFGGRWVMAAESWDDPALRQTMLYSSIEGTAWDRVATLDFQVQYLRPTNLGLLAIGFRGMNNSEQWITATSIDGRTWSSSILNLGVTSPVQSVLVDGDRVVLIVSEDVTGFSKDRRARLLSSRDGLSWQSMPTPPCFVPGDYVGPAAAVGGTWAIVIDAETERLAVSRDQGTTWSCTSLTGEVFEARWGPPYLTGISDVQGKLALIGGRTIEPGAQGNWAAAIWYVS